jgi:RNA polymerase sigma factor (sigma-70 family)
LSATSTPPDSRGSRDCEGLYEDLVQRHAARVWRMAYRLTGDHADAEDLTQEAYYEAWRSIGTLREPEAGGGWLIRILIHRASRRLRRIRTTPELERLQDGALEEAAAAEFDLGGSQVDIQAALDGLDPDRRMVFLEGFTCREAGEMLDIPLGTVLSRIHRARAELRVSLRHMNPAMRESESHGRASGERAPRNQDPRNQGLGGSGGAR